MAVDSGQWEEVAVFGLDNGRLDCSFKAPFDLSVRAESMYGRDEGRV